MSGAAALEGAWVEPGSGRRFHYRLWQPASPRALIVLVHGFGEHGGRYQPAGEALAEQGMMVAVPDLWGHGRSGGPRGDSARLEADVEAVRAMAETVFLPASGRQGYVVYGHSFGGLLAILMAMQPPRGLLGMVVQSPLLQVGFRISPWKSAGAALLGALWPTFPFRLALDRRALSRDASVGQAYAEDPMVHDRITARTYHAIRRAQAAAMGGSSAIRVPTLLLCGSADRIIAVEAAQRWCAGLTCERAATIFPEAYHELHHEPIREDVLRRVHDWAVAHG